ncbi:hypothetical protein [Streptomyces sp. NBC_00582]|uniref:hypothetical protein n=1 Tax=Streptomyces sp. NBC_00582 TaxID=2975783 RepID=UPI002E821DAE|nr:hypothetical protein [Streptomyces sp. NBC_00582]WUB64434.1 hypothetical protein OG852_30600 [Streptomyces sp. NBC_00582]
MATGELACHVRCPVCGEEITLDAVLRLGMKRMVLGIDLAPVHAHIAEQHPDQSDET